LHNVHGRGHLEEYEDSMPERNQLREDAVEQFKLPRRPKDVIVGDEILVAVEKHERVVATFSELHNDIVYCSVAQLNIGWVKVQCPLFANVVVENALP